MLRCGCCEIICDSYEDWLAHLVSPEHQANFGVSELFTNHSKHADRNERSVLVMKMNPTSQPYDVICHFASIEPLGFITDAFVHMFQNVNERFYLIVYDQKKFVDRIIHLQEKCGDQKVLSSVVHVEDKSQLTAKNWADKIQGSFFYRRHEHVKRKLNELSWDNQLNSLLKQVSLNQEGYTARENIMEELEGLIREGEEFPDCVLKPFGSCTTWLADINADLDLFVDILGDGGRMDKDRETKLETMNKVERILRKKYGGNCTYVIRNARVPIVVLTHPSGLKVDFSFENILSVQNSNMIRLLTRFDYRIRPLLLFLRYWARFHNLIGSQSIKSYALILMTFVYLRKLKILPSVYELQTVEGTKDLSVCGWNAGFCQSRGCTINHYKWLKCRKEGDPVGLAQEVVKLAYGFFKEYSELDYNDQVICPLVGGYLPKSLFSGPNGAKLSNEFQLYKANVSTGECLSFNTDGQLCIQDPFALNVNVTASCKNQDTLLTFKVACMMAVEALKPYVSTYDSCGTVNMLELCCQPVPNCRKDDERKKICVDAPEENEDQPRIKTESMDCDYEGEGLSEDDDIWMKAARETRKSRGKSDDLVQNWSSAVRKSGESRWDRQDGDRKGIRVARVPLYDGKETFVTNLMDVGYEDIVKEEEQNQSGKTLKSVVVVASKIKTEKTSPTRNSSSAAASSGDNIKREFLNFNSISGSQTRKQTPSTSGSSKSKVSTQLPKENALTSASSPVDPVVKFVSTPELSLHLHKLPPPEVKFVEGEVKPLTSLLVPYSDVEESDKTIEEDKTENEPEPPVIPPPSSVTPAIPQDNSFGYERTVVHTPKQPNVNNSAKEKPPQSIYMPPNARSAPSEDTSENAEKYLATANKTRSDTSAETPSINRNQPNSKTKKSRSTIPSEEEFTIEFPRFACYMTNEFIDEFYKIVGPVVTPTNSELVDMKMEIIWANFISDLFSDNNFWLKLSIVLEDLEYSKLDKAQVGELQQHLRDYSKYVTIHSDNRKRSNTYSSSGNEYPESEGGRSKVMKTSYNGDITSDRAGSQPENQYSNELKDHILSHLSKVPANQRKSFALSYNLRCYPRKIQALHSQWLKITNQLKAQVTNKQTPLELFGKICVNVDTAVTAQPGELACEMQMVMLIETGPDAPVLYFGFPKLLRYEEHDEENDESGPDIDVTAMLETIMKEIVVAYVDHRLYKLFK